LIAALALIVSWFQALRHWDSAVLVARHYVRGWKRS
jgi:hypothetical protein